MGGGLWASHSVQLSDNDPEVQFDATEGSAQLA